MTSAPAAKPSCLQITEQAFAARNVSRITCRREVDFDQVLYLPRPARGVRFDPLDAPGEFRLELLHMAPLSCIDILRWTCGEQWRRFWSRQPAGQAIKPQMERGDALGADLPTPPIHPTAGLQIGDQRSSPVAGSGDLATGLDQPLVSIIVPCAGRPTRVRDTGEYHLARCLASVRGVSTYTNYELIVVHDGTLPDVLQSELTRNRVERGLHRRSIVLLHGI